MFRNKQINSEMKLIDEILSNTTLQTWISIQNSDLPLFVIYFEDTSIHYKSASSSIILHASSGHFTFDSESKILSSDSPIYQFQYPHSYKLNNIKVLPTSPLFQDISDSNVFSISKIN